MREQNSPKDVCIGIVGGMGPAAGVLLHQLITEATPATHDQDHFKVLCFSNPQIPDRTESLAVDGGANFVSAIQETVAALGRAGATVILIPCHTAHARLEEIRRGSALPIVDMITTTLDWIKQKYPTAKRIGVLATDGAVRANVYGNVAERSELTVVYPRNELQKPLMDAIYRVKAGKNGEAVTMAAQTAINELETGADVIILGCTELSLLFDKLSTKQRPLVDPLRILARSVVSSARAKSQ